MKRVSKKFPFSLLQFLTSRIFLHCTEGYSLSSTITTGFVAVARVVTNFISRRIYGIHNIMCVGKPTILIPLNGTDISVRVHFAYTRWFPTNPFPRWHVNTIQYIIILYMAYAHIIQCISTHISYRHVSLVSQTTRMYNALCTHCFFCLNSSQAILCFNTLCVYILCRLGNIL